MEQEIQGIMSKHNRQQTVQGVVARFAGATTFIAVMAYLRSLVGLPASIAVGVVTSLAVGYLWLDLARNVHYARYRFHRTRALARSLRLSSSRASLFVEMIAAAFSETATLLGDMRSHRSVLCASDALIAGVIAEALIVNTWMTDSIVRSLAADPMNFGAMIIVMAMEGYMLGSARVFAAYGFTGQVPPWKPSADGVVFWTAWSAFTIGAVAMTSVAAAVVAAGFLAGSLGVVAQRWNSPDVSRECGQARS